MSSMGTFARSANMAATIISGQDTSDDALSVVVQSTLDLTQKLYEGQSKLISSLDIRDDGAARSTYTGKPRNDSKPAASGASGSYPLSDKQRSSAGAAINKLGDDAPYTLEDLEAMSTEGGQGSERSIAIGKVFDAAYGGK